MKAAFISRPGGPEVLEVREVPAPEPRANEVLVRVMAAGVNRADLLQRQGKYPAPADAPQEIPGLEFAGEVAKLGQNAGCWKIGQRVFGICGGGAQAEFLAAHELMLTEVPANLSWSEAAGITEVFITAHDALFTQAGLRAGERLLVHAAGSGVGLAAIQLARAWGAEVYGTSRTAEKLQRAREFGLQAEVVVNDPAELPEKVKALTGGHGVDVVLDLVGGSYVVPSVAALAPKGRLLLVGTVAGGKAELALGQVMSKRLKIMGTTLRGRSLEEKIAATQAFAREVVPLLASGKIRATIDREFPLAEIAAAHKRVEMNDTFGKVIIKIGVI